MEVERPQDGNLPGAPVDGELILYHTPKGKVRIEVLYESETFWLNQAKIAELFGVDLRTLSCHPKSIYESGELQRERTLRKIWRIQTEGSREVRRKLSSTTWTPSSRSGAVSTARRPPSSAYGRPRRSASSSSRVLCWMTSA